MSTNQYTLRGIPERLDRRLRDLAKSRGRSLNAVAVEALERGSGGKEGILEFDDIDDLIGTWQEDSDCQNALDSMRKIDPELWR
jgi:hypothetical protein